MSNIESVQNVSDLENKLSKLEQLRSSQISNNKRKLQYLVGHAIIRDVCGENASIDENGALLLTSAFASISHKDNIVVVAISDKAIGIDIENAEAKRDFVGISEIVGISSSADKNTFYKNFVRYESDFKFGKNSEYANHYFYMFDKYIIGITSLENNDNISFIEYESLADISGLFIRAK